ncbi:MAG: hypothetical protein ACRCX2_27760, partial [Paraclostridium sp.]
MGILKTNKELLTPYLPEITNRLRKLAYEFTNIPHLFNVVSLDYSPEHYDVGLILGELEDPTWDKSYKVSPELTEDILNYITTSGNYDNIFNKCDKYIILPDILSNSWRVDQNDSYRNQQVNNLIFFGENIWELLRKDLYHINILYNGKWYLFYDSKSKNGNMMNFENIKYMTAAPKVQYFIGVNPGILHDATHVTLDIHGNVVEPGPNTVTISISLPTLEFDNGDQINVYKKVNDVNIRTREIDFMRVNWVDPDKRLFHDRNSLLTSSAIGYTLDGKIEFIDLRNHRSFNRIDKHTLEIPNLKEYSKLLVFIKDFDYDGYDRIDTVYDEVMRTDSSKLVEMSKSEKDLSWLSYLLEFEHHKMNDDGTIHYEELLDLMFNMDFDIFKVVTSVVDKTKYLTIQDATIIRPYSKFKDKYIHNFKFVYKIFNPLYTNPLVFKDGLLLNDSHMLVHEGEYTWILIDGRHFDTEHVEEIVTSSKYVDELMSKYSKLEHDITIAIPDQYEKSMQHYDYPVIPYVWNGNKHLIIKQDVLQPFDSQYKIDGYMEFVNGRLIVDQERDTTYCDLWDNSYEPGYNSCHLYNYKTPVSSYSVTSDRYKVEEITLNSKSKLLKFESSFVTPNTLIFNDEGRLISDRIGRVVSHKHIMRTIGNPDNENTLKIYKVQESGFPLEFDYEFSKEALESEMNYSILSNPNISSLFDIVCEEFPERELTNQRLSKEAIEWCQLMASTNIATGGNPYNIYDYIEYMNSVADKIVNKPVDVPDTFEILPNLLIPEPTMLTVNPYENIITFEAGYDFGGAGFECTDGHIYTLHINEYQNMVTTKIDTSFDKFVYEGLRVPTPTGTYRLTLQEGGQILTEKMPDIIPLNSYLLGHRIYNRYLNSQYKVRIDVRHIDSTSLRNVDVTEIERHYGIINNVLIVDKSIP